MKWIEIEAEGDVGSTYVAQVPNGVLVRVITDHGAGPSTEALTFVPGERTSSFSSPPLPSGRDKLDPSHLGPEDRELWETVKAETPEVTQYTNVEFEVLKAGLRALAGR